MAVTRIGLNLVLTSADLSDLLALCSPALSRLSPCPAQGWGPDLPTSQSLPPCGERPQRFPFSLSQARSPRTPPRPRARVPGESEGARGRPYGGHGPAWSRPSASAASLPQLSSETLSFSFTVERDVPVQGLKPAQVKVYDYYETGECGAGGAPGGGPPLPRASALSRRLPPCLLPGQGPENIAGVCVGGGTTTGLGSVAARGSPHGRPSHRQLPCSRPPLRERAEGATRPALRARSRRPGQRSRAQPRGRAAGAGGPAFRAGPRAQPRPRSQAEPRSPVPPLSRRLGRGGSDGVVPSPPQRAGGRCPGSPWACARGWLFLAAAASGPPPTPTGCSAGRLGMEAVAGCGAREERLCGTRPSARAAEGL